VRDEKPKGKSIGVINARRQGCQGSAAQLKNYKGKSVNTGNSREGLLMSKVDPSKARPNYSSYKNERASVKGYANHHNLTDL